MYVKEFSRWVAFHMDFINWLIPIEGPFNIGFKHFFSILMLKIKIWIFGIGILAAFEPL
jgi:hypothetical protein